MNWNDIAADYLAVADEVFGRLQPAAQAVAEELAGVIQAGGKILLCGNGGSAADAQHMAGELVGRFFVNRRAYPALALTPDACVVTCLSNDFGFETVFERQVRAHARAGDALVVFSTSGNAANVCRALEAARALGLLTVGLCGGTGGRVAQLAQHVLCISCTTVVPRIQEGHHLLMHALCQRIEEVVG